MRNHLMIDFETLGSGEDCTVVSLGGVLFNKKGIFAKDEWVFDLESQKERSLCVGTIKWWMKQSPDARKVFNLPPSKPITLNRWCFKFYQWLADAKVDPKELLIWSNGGDFDIPIYCHIFKYEGGDLSDPIPYWNHRCFRTADAIFKIKEKHQRKGTFHRALDDSVYQAECLINLWQGGQK